MADTDPTPRPDADPVVLARFMSKIEKAPNGCWLWRAGHFPQGYGCMWVAGRSRAAHIVAWGLFRGDTSGLCVLHNCPTGDNMGCCNPSHLFLGTQADNVADMVKKQRQAKGERHHSRLHPERVLRGEALNRRVLTVERVRAIRADTGRLCDIARRAGISPALAHEVRARKIWRHVID